MAKDPICGMTVDEATALSAERHGQPFYFCSEHCRKKFLSAPATKKQEEKKKAQKSQGKTIYTCPMHPEIEQDHPGDCPKCGMALEPKSLTAGTDDEENTELHDMTRRFWIGAALALPVFVLAMAHLVPAIGPDSWVMSDASRWIQFALYYSRRAVGGLAVLQTWLALRHDASLEHVHADCHRRGRGLCL